MILCEAREHASAYSVQAVHLPCSLGTWHAAHHKPETQQNKTLCLVRSSHHQPAGTHLSHERVVFKALHSCHPAAKVQLSPEVPASMLCFSAKTARHGIHTATDDVGLHRVHSDLQSQACLKMGSMMATRACVTLSTGSATCTSQRSAVPARERSGGGVAVAGPAPEAIPRMPRSGSTACASTHRRAGRLPERAAPLSAC